MSFGKLWRIANKLKNITLLLKKHYFCFKYLELNFNIMIQIIEDYKNHVNSLPEKISNSFYKAEYFYSKLNITKATYYRKLKKKLFTLEEIERLTVLLYPNEVLMSELQKSNIDSKEGKYRDFSLFKKDLEIEHNIKL